MEGALFQLRVVGRFANCGEKNCPPYCLLANKCEPNGARARTPNPCGNPNQYENDVGFPPTTSEIVLWPCHHHHGHHSQLLDWDSQAHHHMPATGAAVRGRVPTDGFASCTCYFPSRVVARPLCIDCLDVMVALLLHTTMTNMSHRDKCLQRESCDVYRSCEPINVAVMCDRRW